MALLNRAGRFIATIKTLGISDTGKPPKCTAVIEYGIDQEHVSGKWVDVSNENASITGYFYLENNQGDLNDFTIKALRDSLAWNGRDIDRLREAAGCQVQITTELEEYQGKARCKVKFMNNGAWDGTGGGVQHDPDAVKRAQSRLGSKLKALSGGTPAPAVKAAEPVADEEPAPWDDPTQTSKRPSAQTAIWNGDSCWDLFTQKYQSLKGPAQTNAWLSFLRRIAPGVSDDSQLTSEQWAALADEIQTSKSAVV